MNKKIAPSASVLQKKTSLENSYDAVPKKCLVTGGSGFVGLRLVEMLVERGAEKVIALDIVDIKDLPEEARKTIWRDDRIEYVVADITNFDAIAPYFEDIDCVWHMAAAVGPYHPKDLYVRVNYEGTQNVVHACDMKGVSKLVLSSSPSTRMNGSDIDGLSEAELPSLDEMNGKWLQAYAETKAFGEKYAMNYCLKHNAEQPFYAIAVAPHQVYGPRDNLFLPNLLEAGASNKLRTFAKGSTGYGKNRVCFTHVDNYCHGLIIAEKKLFKNSPVLGKFYIVTDGDTHPYKEGYLHFWEELDKCFAHLEFPQLKDKYKLPYWLLLPISYVCLLFGMLTGLRIRLTPFAVKLLTMHRWFRIDSAQNDLGYKPIISYEEGWQDTMEWFKENWLPEYHKRVAAGTVSLSEVSSNTLKKIDIQAKKEKSESKKDK